MFYRYDSPVGELYLEMERDALTGLWFCDGRFTPRPEAFVGENAAFAPVVHWLDAYFAGEQPHVGAVKRALRGSAFQKLVWEELERIPYGAVTTYGAIAGHLERKLGRRVAAQAVGGAVGHNPISILIPCHRVVGAGGKLTGYGGGLWRKEYLLALERKNT